MIELWIRLQLIGYLINLLMVLAVVGAIVVMWIWMQIEDSKYKKKKKKIDKK